MRNFSGVAGKPSDVTGPVFPGGLVPGLRLVAACQVAAHVDPRPPVEPIFKMFPVLRARIVRPVVWGFAVTGACPSSLLTDRSAHGRDFLPVDRGAGRGAAEDGVSY